MNLNPYESKIQNLLNGDIRELVVSKDDFFEFREIWLNHPQKNEIVGVAHLGGELVYRKINK